MGLGQLGQYLTIHQPYRCITSQPHLHDHYCYRNQKCILHYGGCSIQPTNQATNMPVNIIKYFKWLPLPIHHNEIDKSSTSECCIITLPCPTSFATKVEDLASKSSPQASQYYKGEALKF